MRPFSRLAVPLVVSLALATPATAASFCNWLPEWAEGPCRAASGFLAAPPREAFGGDLKAAWMPEGGYIDPNGRQEPPPPPPAASLAPTETEPEEN
jgi:hypothetical protein